MIDINKIEKIFRSHIDMDGWDRLISKDRDSVSLHSPQVEVGNAFLDVDIDIVSMGVLNSTHVRCYVFVTHQENENRWVTRTLQLTANQPTLKDFQVFKDVAEEENLPQPKHLVYSPKPNKFDTQQLLDKIENTLPKLPSEGGGRPMLEKVYVTEEELLDLFNKQAETFNNMCEYLKKDNLMGD